MLPIRDHNPSTRIAYVTYALMAANIAIFLAYGMGDARSVNQVYMDWAMIPGRVSFGEGYYTFVSSMFLHGGWMHLAGNMLFLWIFGDNIEDEMGHGSFLGLYLLTGIAAGLAHYFAAPGSDVPTVGASGAIAGVMGAYLLLFPKARVDVLLILVVFFRIFPIPAWIVLLVWFGLQFFGGLSADPNTGGVAYWAHAGGFIAGVALGLPVWLRRGAVAFWQRTDGHPPHPEARYDLSRIPKLRRR